MDVVQLIFETLIYTEWFGDFALELDIHEDLAEKGLRFDEWQSRCGCPDAEAEEPAKTAAEDSIRLLTCVL